MRKYRSAFAACLGLLLLALAGFFDAADDKHDLVLNVVLRLVWRFVAAGLLAIPVKIAAMKLKVQSRSNWRCWFVSFSFVTAVSVLARVLPGFSAWLLAPCLLGLWTALFLDTSLLRGYGVVAALFITMTIAWMCIPAAPVLAGVLEIEGSFWEAMRGEPLDATDKAIERSETFNEACQPVIEAGATPAPAELKQQGRKLRQCVDKIFQNPATPSYSKHHGHGGHIRIDTTVAAFIPPGSSLENAEIVLRSAGFHVEGPGEASGDDQYHACLTGRRQYSWTVDMRIHVCPSTEGNPAAVGDEDGEIRYRPLFV